MKSITPPVLKEGDTLTDASGTVWLVERFWIDDDPEESDDGDDDDESVSTYFSITLVEAAHADDMEVMAYELDPDSFYEFCKEHGITL